MSSDCSCFPVTGEESEWKGCSGVFLYVSPLKGSEREQNSSASLQAFLANCTLVSPSLLNPGPQKSIILLPTPT